MKSSYLLPAVAAIVGFAAAWIAKPTGPGPSVSAPTFQEEKAQATNRTRVDRQPTASGKNPKEVSAGDFPLGDQAELGPKSREEAKMMRLAEALGLSVGQQSEIIALIEEAQSMAIDEGPVIEEFSARGKIVEDGLGKILSAGQLAKFQEVRDRERENRHEVQAQKLLTQTMEEIDLSPEQRANVLERLRQKSKADLQSIPAAASLLFDKSLLPTGGKELSAEGILALVQMGEPTDLNDPEEAYDRVVNRHREELEKILECFDGILNPAQMGQFQAGLAEQKELMKKLPRPATELAPRSSPPATEGE